MKIYLLGGAVLSMAVGCTDNPVVQNTEDQPAVAVVEARPGLSDRAQISGARALEIATARFPNGNILEAELEDEDGSLVYEVDLRIPGQRGIQEIVIDAMTGEVLSTDIDLEDEDDDNGDDDDDEIRG